MRCMLGEEGQMTRGTKHHCAVRLGVHPEVLVLVEERRTTRGMRYPRTARVFPRAMLTGQITTGVKHQRTAPSGSSRGRCMLGEQGQIP